VFPWKNQPALLSRTGKRSQTQWVLKPANYGCRLTVAVVAFGTFTSASLTRDDTKKELECKQFVVDED